MGGGGGSHSIGNIRSFIEKAKEELRASEGKRNVFISFAYEDVDEVNLLRAHAKNENSPIEFNDWSVSEPINSERAPYIKQKIGERINQSSLTVVYLSAGSAKSPWVNWEIEESLKRGKRVLGVFKGSTKPKTLPKAFSTNKLSAVPWSNLAATIEKLD